MSHFKQRREKNCLNCGAEVQGHYCHYCGQENVEPKQTAGHLVSHFFNDVTHFDGKFFSTIGLLIRRPGFLTAEYVRGRRVAYLDPIRMYIFTSAIFFLIFFQMYHVEEKDKGEELPTASIAAVSGMSDQQLHQYTWKKYDDSLMTRQKALEKTAKALRQDSVRLENVKKTNFNAVPTDYISVAHYDSAQQQLPPGKKDGFWKRIIVHRELALNELYRKNPEHFYSNMINSFLHTLPKLLFVSLPFFALILKLLYFRHKQLYYTDHGIFSIHLYIFTFIKLMLIFLLLKGRSVSGWSVFGWITAAIILWIFFYLYKAMRNFYKQGRWKTIIKFLLLNFLAYVLVVLLGIIFFVFSVATLV